MREVNGTTVCLEEAQIGIERRFSKKNIRKHLLQSIESSPELMDKIEMGVTLLEEWRHQVFYDSKNKRLEQLDAVDLQELVTEVAITTLPIDHPELYTSVCGRLAASLGFADKGDAIKTISEIVAVLCETDLYDIGRGAKNQLTVVSAYDLPPELRRFIDETKYLPPMLVPPRVLRANHDTGYMETKGTLILGKGNYHEGDLCLDSLNKFNQVPLSLDINMLNLYREMPKKALKTPEAEEQFARMRKDSLHIYADLAAYGNEFYLTHKVDKRGRTYAQGYHVSTQGSAFKKSILNLHKKEVIEGVY